MRVTPANSIKTKLRSAPFRLSLAAALVSSFSATVSAQEGTAAAQEPVLEEVVVLAGVPGGGRQPRRALGPGHLRRGSAAAGRARSRVVPLCG